MGGGTLQAVQCRGVRHIASLDQLVLCAASALLAGNAARSASKRRDAAIHLPSIDSMQRQARGSPNASCFVAPLLG